MTGDILYFQTFDGNEIFFPDDEVKILTWGNAGAPPVNFITRKGYLQHGSSEVGYLLEPRTISVELWHSPACTRQQYWDNRLALHEFLRHNRGGPFQYVLRQPNGNKRALTVRANPGLQFPAPEISDNNWSIDETIDLIAFDPIWFNPDLNRLYLSGAVNQQLIFPITFPIFFGSSHVLAYATITYTGTWITYPTLTVIGPYTAVAIKNVQADATIYLTVPIGAADRRIITLTPGAQTVTDGFGVNKFGDLGDSSNLVGFGLLPDPLAPGGQQLIVADFTGGAAASSALQIDYLDRYFAI